MQVRDFRVWLIVIIFCNPLLAWKKENTYIKEVNINMDFVNADIFIIDNGWKQKE